MTYILLILTAIISGCCQCPTIVHEIECDGKMHIKQTRCSHNPFAPCP